jgi:hypothetical protein
MATEYSAEANLTEQPSKQQGLRRDQLDLDLEAVLRLPQGRRVMLRILERCGVTRNAYSSSAKATAFRLGEQNVGLWLMAQMDRVGPTEYPRLLLEAAQNTEDKDAETVE